ncbi:hypothetical protein EJW20_001690 [Escherichia coli]|nr:hypothetical protein [Escherichia coli]
MSKEKMNIRQHGRTKILKGEFMNSDIKTLSISGALPGWWARFKDDDGTEWYSPIAAWALCEVAPCNTGCAYQEILPVLPGEAGMEPHYSDCGACECLYLPDKKFVHCGESWVFAWYPVNDGSNSGTLE